MLMKRTAGICVAMMLSLVIGYGQGRSANDPDQKELYGYVLTMDKVKKLGAATHEMQDAAKKHPDLDRGNGGDAEAACVMPVFLFLRERRGAMRSDLRRRCQHLGRGANH